MKDRTDFYYELLAKFNVGRISELEADSILNEYAEIIGSVVMCPYKPEEYLTGKNEGRTTVHLAFPKPHQFTGIGSIAYGDTPLEAKLNLVYSFMRHGYFDLSQDLKVINPLIQFS